MKKINYNCVKSFIESLGFNLLNKEYLKNDKPLIIYDKEGYYYKTTYSNLKTGRYPLKFIKSNPYVIQNIKLWCKINDKPFELLSDIYNNNSEKLKWKCLKDKCGDIFLCCWSSILNGGGCGVCHGKQVGISNCLATKNPELIKEWHPTKNNKLTPYNITYGSSKRVWWKCIKGHEWEVSVYNRVHGYNCPYCSGQLPSKEYNLLVHNPKLCNEWDYIKNDTNPENHTPYSGKKVWWLCKNCNYSWRASIAHRNNDRGCPLCNKSKGEKQIKNILNKYNIKFISQKTYDNLLGLRGGLLSYDFYLPNYNILIEYQGEFHDGKAKIQSQQSYQCQQEHDKRKKEYAKNNNIKLLEIWYYDFNKIEEILNQLLTQNT